MRVRSVFLLSIALGSAVGVLAASLFATQQWSAFQAAVAARDDTLLLVSALRLPEMMNMERAFINPRLIAPAAATPQQLAPIRQQTELVDASLLDAWHLATKPVDIATLQAVQHKLLDIRSDALAAIGQGGTERSITSVTTYVSDMFDVQKAAYHFATTIHERINASKPRIGQATRLALLAWDLRDWSGRETTLFISYLGKHLPMADEQAETLAIYKGRLEQKWEAARAFATTVNNPEVTAALVEVERGFWARGGEAYATQVVPNHGRILDLNPDSFVISIRPILDTILPLRDAALTEALRECESDITVRRMQFLLAFGLLLLTACAAATATRWFDRLVLRPISEITIVILALAGGDRDRELPLQRRAGELGQMARAIETLRCNAIHAQAIADDMLALQKARADEKSRLLAELTQANAKLEGANLALETLAATDALTGVANRRSFDLCLAREWHRAQRETKSLGLLLLDIDHFKSFNDRYGHPAGDKCLASVAASVTKAVRRPGDTTARYGGEEFAVILVTADLDGAIDVAERIRRSVAALSIPHQDNPCGIVTVSIGVSAIIPYASETVEAFVNDADLALYAAKHAGRNQVSTGTTSDAALQGENVIPQGSLEKTLAGIAPATPPSNQRFSDVIPPDRGYLCAGR